MLGPRPMVAGPAETNHAPLTAPGATRAMEAVLERVLEARLRQARDTDAVFAAEMADRLAAYVRRGGKRLRTAFVWCGWRAAGGSGDASAVLRTGAALELLQACALIHDDVMDDSPLRRGAPAMHVDFAERHRAGRLGGFVEAAQGHRAGRAGEPAQVGPAGRTDEPAHGPASAHTGETSDSAQGHPAGGTGAARDPAHRPRAGHTDGPTDPAHQPPASHTDGPTDPAHQPPASHTDGPTDPAHQPPASHTDGPTDPAHQPPVGHTGGPAESSPGHPAATHAGRAPAPGHSHPTAPTSQPPESFGKSAAVLVGDLALAWADDLLAETALASAHGPRLFEEWRAMRTEMVAGQYRDLRAQANGSSGAEEALTIAVLKSARYTVARPLALGASLAGADARTLGALRSAGRCAGLAFQLRDDLLGAFGDPALTGKPADEDLRARKLTPLLAVAVRLAEATGDRDAAAALAPDADARAGHRVERMRAALERTGARAEVEGRIADLAASALRHFEATGAAPGVRREFAALVERASGVTPRQAEELV